MNRIIRYFDLYSQYKVEGAKAQDSRGRPVRAGMQDIVYLSCLVGILAGPFVAGALAGEYPTFWQFFGGVGRLFWSALFGAILTAALFKIWLTPRSLFVVQVGVALAVGIASARLVPLALNALTGSL
jgi:hypothetical protein